MISLLAVLLLSCTGKTNPDTTTPKPPPQAMKNDGSLQLTTPSDTEILMERIFNAPPELVYKVMTDPELLQHWYGPEMVQYVSSQMDVRVGGSYAHTFKAPDGSLMTQAGEYKEVVPGKKIVFTERWVEMGTPDMLVTSHFYPEGEGQTRLHALLSFPSKEVRDAVLQSGMEDGAAETYTRLATYLASVQ